MRILIFVLLILTLSLARIFAAGEPAEADDLVGLERLEFTEKTFHETKRIPRASRKSTSSRTVAVLTTPPWPDVFAREMVGWPSPDKRKVFTDEFDLGGSKVERAELIDQKTGQVLCDLTGDDIGVGADREGEILWSPDSKRFAYESSDLTQHEGNLFSIPRPPPQRKQTAVYQLTGETFIRVDLPLSGVPDRENDLELKGAILGHDYIEAVRWAKPAVLNLERHEYYRKLMPTEVDGVKFESIRDLARWYRITATIAPDGKATLTWKLRKD